ncbi:DNA transposition AAA+ family ATPase [Gluconobacter cerinus]|uniref:ATP-binding protein n=1 Tax=Gluconobacter cerinus TaxID=38307 RepID=UPI0022260FCD|nr:ATP-binding protein [Gluconobacter cerinus]MCW2266727.1 DNA transposition AAA+ family ATPase [Gluconobacter cerinus]
MWFPTAVLRQLAELVGATEKRGTRMMASTLNRVRDTPGLLIIDEAQNFTTEAIDLLRTINYPAITWDYLHGKYPP